MQGLSEVVPCLSALLPLTSIVDPGVPVEGGSTAVPERRWRMNKSLMGIFSLVPGIPTALNTH